MSSISCTEVEESVPALALGALDENERTDVMAHIDSCPHCRELLQDHAALARNMLFAVPERLPPSSLKRDLLARVNRSQSRPRITLGDWLKGGLALPRWGAAVGLACAAILVVGFGFALLQLVNQQNMLAQQLQQQQRVVAILVSPDTESVSMNGTKDAVGAVGQLRYNPQDTAAVLSVQNMPALAMSQSYQLWLVDADGKRDSGAVFSVPANVNGPVTLIVLAPRQMKTYVRYGVSIEPYGGSPMPTGPAALAGKL